MGPFDAFIVGIVFGYIIGKEFARIPKNQGD